MRQNEERWYICRRCAEKNRARCDRSDPTCQDTEPANKRPLVLRPEGFFAASTPAVSAPASNRPLTARLEGMLSDSTPQAPAPNARVRSRQAEADIRYRSRLRKRAAAGVEGAQDQLDKAREQSLRSTRISMQNFRTKFQAGDPDALVKMAKLLKKYNASNAKIRAEKRGSASNVQADEDESVSTNRPISEEDWQSLMADSVLLKDCGFTNADLEGFMLEES